jgi:hypothetical protein
MLDGIVLVVCFLVGALVGTLLTEPHKKRVSEIIEHGCGEYHSQTGEFIWKDSIK